jgi:hypothetical protein
LLPPGPGPELLPQEFQRLEGERVSVAYQGEVEARAQAILDFLHQIPPLPALPASVPDDLTLFIAPDQAAFDSLTGGAVPEWGAGVAIPRLNRIVMPGYGPQRSRGLSEARVLRHEWAHLGLHQYLTGLRVPQWFDEGFAEWASGGWTPTEGWKLRVAFALGRAPDLDSLALAWPRDRAQASLAYLISATTVEYLVSESGERGLRIFLERWREVGSFDVAMRSVYGLTLGQFEEDWKGYVRKRYGWLFVLSHSSIFWVTLALALLLMVRIRRGRNREAMARLRAGEPPDSPAYWAETVGDSSKRSGEAPTEPGDPPEQDV